MRRSVVHRSPKVSCAILFSLLVPYLLLCMPAIGRRGHWDLEPFWMAMPFLWVVPIVLSAPFDRLSRARVWSLLGYTFATAVIVAGAYGRFASPRHVTLDEALAPGLFPFWPIHLVVAAVIEAGAQFVLRYIRALREPDARTRQTPPTSGIPSPRLGPTGAPTVDAGTGQPTRPARPSPTPMMLYLVGVVTLSLAFPFLYHWGAFAEARWGSGRAADRDWAEGRAIWFMSVQDPDFSPGMVGLYDARTGLEIHPMHWGPVMRAWQEAYREAIEEKLARFGPAPMVRHLFTNQQMRDLIRSGRLEPLSEFPLRHGRLTVRANGSITTPDSASSIDPVHLFCYKAVLPEKGNVLVLVNDQGVWNYHPDGRLLQAMLLEPDEQALLGFHEAE